MKVLTVSVTQRGRALAGHLPWEHVHGPAGDLVRQRWSDVDGLVLMLATGAAVRICAPLLMDKHRDPAVVCVDEMGRFAVALVGGHAGGANDLARTVAAHLGAEPVITTATDAAGQVGLDQLPGFEAEGDVAAVTTALLDGRPVAVDNPMGWPVPWRGDSASSVRILVSDRTMPPESDSESGVGRAMAVVRPPSLVAGIGTSTSAPPDEVHALLDQTLAAAGLSRASVAEVATIDRRADHPAIVALGLPVRTFSPAQLAAVAVPTPSAIALATVGTPSVCEAAALLAAGVGGQLVVTKQRGPTATVAIARRGRPRGELQLVGLGPGSPDHRTAAAERAVRRANVVIGYQGYVDQCADLLAGWQETFPSSIGDEVVRAKQALSEAAAGRKVAVVCSGDSGVYGMAAIVMELADGEPDVDVEVVPGVSASVAAAALLGAPLGHDHANISLSDLLTPWATIECRLRAAAHADLVVSLYNPRSKGRAWQLEAARAILLSRRSPETPVGAVTNAGRPGQRVTVTTLGGLDVHTVGMTTCLIVGSSTTRVVSGRMVTPRGYRP